MFIIKLYIFDNVYYYLYLMSATCWITLGMVCGMSVWSKIIRTCRGMICVSHSVVSDSLQPRDYSPPCSSVHYKQARILEWAVIPSGALPSQGSNLGLRHCRQILYCLSHQGSLEGWKAAWSGQGLALENDDKRKADQGCMLIRPQQSKENITVS